MAKTEIRPGKPAKVSAKLQSLTLEQRAYPFVLTMGVLGALMGGVTTNIEIQSCSKIEQCTLVNAAQKRLDAIETGAFVGMGAAFMVSLPAILGYKQI